MYVCPQIVNGSDKPLQAVYLTSAIDQFFFFQIKMESEGQVFVKTEKEEIEEDDETQYLAVMPPCEEIIKSEG